MRGMREEGAHLGFGARFSRKDLGSLLEGYGVPPSATTLREGGAFQLELT